MPHPKSATRPRAVCAVPARLRHGLSALAPLLVALAALPAVAQDGSWDPSAPDPAQDTVPLHVEAPAGMEVCLGGYLLTSWLQGGSSCDLMIRPGQYLAHGTLPGCAYLTTVLTVEATADTTFFALPTPPDVRGNWSGALDGMDTTWTIAAHDCPWPQCFDDQAPTCGLIGTAPVDGEAWALGGITYEPGEAIFMMTIGPAGVWDPARLRLVFGRLTEDERSLIGTTAPVGDAPADDPAGGQVPFVLSRVEVNVTATDPRATSPDEWVTVHLDGPAGTQLCIDGTRLPAGTTTFWVRPLPYGVFLFGDGRMNASTTLDAESTASDLTLAVAPQPDVTGTWSGEFDGRPVRATISAVPCGTSGCLASPGFSSGLAGSLQVLDAAGNAADPGQTGAPTQWRLEDFEWVSDQDVVAFTGLPADQADDGSFSGETRTFWLERGANGSLSGTVLGSGDDDDLSGLWDDDSGDEGGDDESGSSHQAITLFRDAR